MKSYGMLCKNRKVLEMRTVLGFEGMGFEFKVKSLRFKGLRVIGV